MKFISAKVVGGLVTKTKSQLSKIRWFGLSRLIGMAVIVMLVAIAGWWLVSVPPPPPEAKLPFAGSTTVAGTSIAVGGVPNSNIAVVVNPQFVTVHVAGAVKTPGVYRLRFGSRVNDGVAAAGGATSVANLDVINLATVLNEGEQIYIPKRGEKPHTIESRAQVGGSATRSDGGASVSTGASVQLININLATPIELESLPGVGPSTAKAIVAYREKYGAFLAVEDLLKVRGIGPAKLGEIMPRARVN